MDNIFVLLSLQLYLKYVAGYMHSKLLLLKDYNYNNDMDY